MQGRYLGQLLKILTAARDLRLSSVDLRPSNTELTNAKSRRWIYGHKPRNLGGLVYGLINSVRLPSLAKDRRLHYSTASWGSSTRLQASTSTICQVGHD